MSHLSIKLTRSIRLLLAARLGIVLSLSLALWLGLGWGLVGASRLPTISGGGVTGDVGDEVSYDFARQGTCAITVTNAYDSGAGSLRQAIADVCDDGGRITFDADYTIYLTSTLEISRRLTIDGEAHAVAVSGDSGGDGTPNVRVFTIASSSVATLTHLSIVSGTTADDDGGGGISNYGSLTMQNSALSGNSATSRGGGIYNAGTLTIQSSTLSGNSAGYGGGISNYGPLTVQNSTLSGNSATSGGGIYNSSTSTLTVQSSTLAGNSAGYGGGIANYGSLSLSHTLIAYSPRGNDCVGSPISGGLTTNDHNLIQSTGGFACGIANGAGGSLIGVDPLLGPLADNGGPSAGSGQATFTHALLPGSPAIDAGTSCQPTDQRGIPRPQGMACDIGAFETRGFSLTLAGGDNQSTPINAPFAQPLSVVVSSTYGEPVGPGGVIRFGAPGAGASLAPATLAAVTDAGGAAGVTATANGLDGSYTVTATATGVMTPVIFSLTNTPAPALAVLGTGQVIPDGDATPSAADGTDFGNVAVGQALTHTFAISNRGTADLILTGSPAISIGGPAAPDFSLVASPSTPVAPNATTTFQVRFAPSVFGTRAATVTIASDDPVKNPYDFAIQGTGCSSALTVIDAGDSGPGSLRQAIADACPGGRITFAGDYTIYLTTTLEITQQLTVDGETHTVAVSGDSGGDGTPDVRVLSIASSGVVTLTHLSIVSGTASDGSGACPGDCGGGIYNSGRLTVQNSTLAGNSADDDGGGISNHGPLTVQNSTFAGNSADDDGGGISHSSGALVLVASTFSGNSALNGGGIYNVATLTVQNSTFVGNSAAYWGGGIYNYTYSGTLYLYNTLIANSLGSDCAGSVATSVGNLIADGSCSPAISGTPYLGPLGDYGGDTPTVPLLPGSPAIDAGTSCQPTDQRGIPRPQGMACDIGAFETRGFSLALAGGDNQSTPIYAPFAQPLSVTVSSTYGEPVGPGGVIRFSAPGAGASLAPATLAATTDAGGAAGVTATANGLDGSYTVTATVQGVGTPVTFSLTNTPGPTMAVLGNGQVISDGDATPSTADDTDFGGMLLGQALTHTFIISNRGTEELALTGSPAISIGGPAALDFGLVASPALALAPNTTTTFQVRFTPSVTGLAVATITIASNDLVRTPYDFAVQGQLCSYDITVTDATDSGPGSLRQAIANACDGGRITFAGDYIIYLTTSLTISKRLTVDGSGHAVAVSGDSGGDGTANVRVFSISKTTSVVTLTHLSVVSGTASSGGGIYNQGTLTIQDSTFAGNSASSGGGIHSYWGTLTVRNSIFTGNSAGAYGGGIYNQRTLAVTDSTFSGNSAREGGGIASSGSSPQTIQNSTFAGNSAATYGGDIFSSGRLTVQNSSFAGNSTAARGGSMYNLGGTLVVQNSVLFGSSATDDGGGICNSSGTLTVTNSTLSGNSAADDGGGIYSSGTLAVQNSTFSGNSVLSYGGGIYNQKTLVVTNSTFAGNSAADGGGGIFSQDKLHLFNTLIAHSPAGGDCQGSVATNDHNLIESIHSNACLLTNGSGGSLIGVDPRLGPLGDYGGGTPTISLLPGSPALDAGNTGACLATDQRGVARPQGAACDIGAFESRGFSLALAGGDNQSALINNTFAHSLSVVVSSADGAPAGPGVVITFTAPAAGASLNPNVLAATTDAGGAAGVTATANGLVGSYVVTATAAGVGAAPVVFNLTNTPPVPAMAVVGNGRAIADGDPTPSAADRTDFGDVTLGQTVTHSFTISNGGTADLALTSSPAVSITGPAALDFSLVASPAITVAPGATTTFQVRFTPSLTGTRVATVTITNNDPSHNLYDFAIQGTASDESNERHIFLPVILRGAQ